ncbi:acidic endochitinase-like [Zingiber officinale]|uniref:acidic endochitinase-like n=1 Tax=Zingiber officinale TaxID=94328 RepID=UPI001C4C5D53|nr:acidic endochitinase-like [Zingiber officinale]
MASPSHLLLIVFLLPALAAFSNAGNIAIYWGQNGNEGSLADTCNTGLYSYVMISFLTTFGNGQTPVLNLAGHCDPPSGTCIGLSDAIRQCQSQGIRVLLSLGGSSGSYSISSDDDATSVARYLWHNYLGGSSSSRPLGDAALDGIDFDIAQGTSDNYGYLAQSLLDLGSQAGTKVYLSAAPQCPFPDQLLGPALRAVTFDYVWVQFYNNPSCDYSSGVSGVAGAWRTWTSSLQSSTVFLGVPASTDAAGSGYIPPGDLTSQVLPAIKQASNYGGIMLWSRYFDRISGYSAAVQNSTQPKNLIPTNSTILIQVKIIQRCPDCNFS